MFDRDRWQEIFTSIQRHKLRTLLTAFGVFWGIFLLMLLLGVGKGLENGAYSQFGASATNRFVIWGRTTGKAYKGLNPGRPVRLTTDDLEAIQQMIPEAKAVNASMGLWGDNTVVYQGKTGSFSVRGELPALMIIRPMKMVLGRFLNAADVQGKRKVAVIGQKVKDVLFGQENPVGNYIHINGVFFQVVGVFDFVGLGSHRRQSEQVYLPLQTLQRAFNQGNRIWSLNVVVDDDAAADVIEEKTTILLKHLHTVAPDDNRAFGSWNASEEFAKLQRLFRGIRIFLWIVGTGTILAGVIGVSNIMLIIVKERTREIGIRKALGATPFSIISLILQESIFITAVSGYTGLVASVGMLEGASYLMEKFDIKNEFFSRPEIDFSIATLAIVILIVAGTVAGFIPARSAARIHPIEALRSE